MIFLYIKIHRMSIVFYIFLAEMPDMLLMVFHPKIPLSQKNRDLQEILFLKDLCYFRI